MTTTLSSKGQIVIPLEIRQRLDLPAGTVIECYLEDGRIILDPIGKDQPAQLIRKSGKLTLAAPEHAPEMTPQRVKEILSAL